MDRMTRKWISGQQRVLRWLPQLHYISKSVLHHRSISLCKSKCIVIFNIIYARVFFFFHFYGCITGLILGLREANERRRYFVTTSLIGRRKPRISPLLFHYVEFVMGLVMEVRLTCQLMAKPGNKTAIPSWPSPNHLLQYGLCDILVY